MKQNENKPILENYILIEKLGGQQIRKFGHTYLAKRKEDDTKVIIKTINLKRSNPQVQAQFKSEQNFTFIEMELPKVIDFFSNDEHLYLVKEFQNGEPLDSYWKGLKRKEQLPFIKTFSNKFIDLLAILHSKEIYHCDLKPSNILVHYLSNELIVELIDFGLAIQQPILEKRKLIFPLGYAAPELILNRLEIVNETTDYFSFGIIIWRLFCGEIPLSHPNPSIYTNLQLVHPLQDNKQLPKGMIEILNNLSQKPSFKTAPNRMNTQDIDRQIEEAQGIRKIQFKNLLIDLEKCNRKRWFQS